MPPCVFAGRAGGACVMLVAMPRVVAVMCALICASALADSYPVRSQRKLELGIHEGVRWPLINAPIDGPLPDAPKSQDPQPAAPTRAGERVLTVIDEIEENLRETSYQARTQVRADAGEYHWDCSGMAAWIMKRAAPKAFRTLGDSRPVARDFAAAIERAPTKKARDGWQRIANIADVMPGDVFAWRRPRGMPSKNTGHVGFVVDVRYPCRKFPARGRCGSRTRRAAITKTIRARATTTVGSASALVLFMTDADGKVTHYGWSGTLSEWYITTSVVFGRLHR